MDYAHSLPYAVNLKGNASEYTSIARSVDLTGKSYVILNFWWKTWSLESGEYVMVDVYDGSWHTLLVRSMDISSRTDWTEETLDLSGYNMISAFRIRVSLFANGIDDDLDFDDLLISGY